MVASVTVVSPFHWFGHSYAANDTIDTSGYDDRSFRRLMKTGHVTVAAAGPAPTVVPSPAAWSTPSDWPALPSVAGSEKFVGLYGVYDSDNNVIALTASGAYHVDWGDGSSADFAAGAQAEHIYTYASLAGSPVSTGEKLVTVTVTPQAGAHLTALNLSVKHSLSGLVTTTYASGWRDIAVAGAQLTSLQFSSSTVVAARRLRRAQLVGAMALTTLASMFDGCSSLDYVSIDTPSATAAATSAASMFNDCRRLTAAPMMDLSSCTSAASMFKSCASLYTIPAYNTPLVTDMSSMFSGCGALTKLPALVTSACLNFSSMFLSCQALREAPAFDLSAATNTSSMFNNCKSLPSIPAYDTHNATDMHSMFTGCIGFTAIPLLNTAKNTDFSGFLSGCSNLESVPLFDTGAGLNFSSMCSSLIRVRSLPTFNTSNGTNFGLMFSGCSSLEAAPPIDTSKGTAFNSMLSSCTALRSVPLYVTTLGTTFANMFTGCGSLTELPNFDMRNATTVNAMLQNMPSLRTFPAWNVGVAAGVASVDWFGFGTTMVALEEFPAIDLSKVGVNGMSFSGGSLRRFRGTGLKQSLTLTNNMLSAAALNEVYTNLGSGVVSKTVTVTGNPGIATDTPATATAKGWTVTGS